MATDIGKITEFRKKEREGKSVEERQALALEQLADSFEAFRQDFVGSQFHINQMTQSLGKIASKP